jgi:Transglycosylase SLT domain
MMSYLRQSRAIAIFALILASGPSPLSLAGEPVSSSCLSAGIEAETRFGVPAGLLLAIGRVESGRRDPATGAVAPWPWTINASGAGHIFDTAPEAVASTRALREQGVGSIDVGCFQINLFHHPEAFSSLEQAFDPTANANYAARFLVSLRERLGNWESAVAAYHSSAPERGGPYRDRVIAGLDLAKANSPATKIPIRTMLWPPNSLGTWMRVWTPSAPGSAPHVISIKLSRASAR